MKYRSKFDIMTAVLHTATGGITKTSLMYKTFLSHNLLNEYLVLLMGGGLLAHDSESRTYTTTPKGNEFLTINDKLNELSGLAVVADIETGKRQRRSLTLPE